MVGAHLALGLEPADVLDIVAALGVLLDEAGMEFRFQALLDAMAEAAASESPEAGRLAVEATTVSEERFVGIAPRLAARG
ncbi:MAG: hypothetical protein AVDCRST_MAG03-2481 [uncultured Rubrobacteraceae bacterium]|uniref:Uncharacterized protein n=1 Tax=uncultured Rubrobacteraceae bacterium TaxID=349277 RepID=A0A6J4PN54_9ACTN|nr:MAG: hypothetical protein AVDCRST_MAG03-2481 [uncultured Rubrobacteraceae bacterium]